MIVFDFDYPAVRVWLGIVRVFCWETVGSSCFSILFRLGIYNGLFFMLILFSCYVVSGVILFDTLSIFFPGLDFLLFDLCFCFPVVLVIS